MSTPTADPAIIKLPIVRLSFPHLFQPHAMEEGQEKKYGATFLLDYDKHATLLDQIEDTIARVALDFWKKKQHFKTCLRDGNEKANMEGYGDGVMFITASNKTRPPVVDGNRSPIVEEDGIIYAGCYVNASIRLWVQDNKWGKRVNAGLRAVQFVKDGESFGAGKVDVDTEFDDVEGADSKATVRTRKPFLDDPMF